jgi:hypothetical protein
MMLAADVEPIGVVDAAGVVDGDVDAEGIIADEMMIGGAISVVDTGASTSIAEWVGVAELSTSPAPPDPPA